jgi:hypothetical protein
MYRPQYKEYISDSEPDSDSESDSSSTLTDETTQEGFQTAPDFSAFAQQLAGESEQDAAVGSVQNSGALPAGSFQTTGYATFGSLELSAKDASGASMTASTQAFTSIIMVDSRDRDKQVYPQPTGLTLRLPRVYKNVTNFQIVQMKLLSAFYYFRTTKANTDISILELGRQNQLNGYGDLVAAVIKNYIRQGTYDINGLLTELMTQLNNVPIFYDYINGFQDFAVKFAVTGDFALNFNYPGDYYYDSLLNTFIPNPTMDLIVSKYFVNRYASLSSYTAAQIKVAYYYPVLKEILLDDTYSGTPVDLTLTTSVGDLLPGETPRSRVIYTFQGLNDPVIQELISTNVAVLDLYRLQHTFRYYLINKYNIYFEAQSNRVVFSAPSLNTSLVNLLNTKRAEFFAAQLAAAGITLAQYNELAVQNTLLLAILNDMYNYIQRYLAIHFGVPFNTFSIDYIASPNFPLPLKDAYNAAGVPSTFNAQVLARPTAAATQSVLSTFQQSAPQYWNRLQGLPNTTVAYMNPVLTGETGDQGLPLPTWNQLYDAPDPVHPIVLSNITDPNNPNSTEVGTLYTNKRTGTADYITPLQASQYTVFRFKSPVRQTLRFTTLPRPTKYRYPAYNAVADYDASNVALFDNSYCFVQAAPTADVSGVQLLTIPGFSTLGFTSSFGASYTSSLAYWSTSYNTLSVLNSRQFYTLYTPKPPGAPMAPAYSYPLAFTVSHAISGETFASPLQVYLYQDRAAFMADISDNRNEKPIHYLTTISTTTALSTLTFSTTVYANKQYYILTRSIDPSFATERYRIVPNFPDGNAYTTLTSNLTGFDPLTDPTSNLTNYNYAQLADPTYIKLPIQSTLWTGPLQDPATSTLYLSSPAIGYDAAGVSTDLTNYIGFVPNTIGLNAVPNAGIRADPTNGFLFQANSPYNPSTQTYFYSTSANALLYPDAAGVYSPSTVANRQASIVQWYGTTFLPPTDNQVLWPPQAIAYESTTAFTASYPVSAPLTGYTYTDLQDVSGNPYLGAAQFLTLGDGVVGIGFAPDRGTWTMDRFMFKTIFTDAAADPNSGIAQIGIFPAAITCNRSLDSLTLAEATAVLSFYSSITYNSSNDNFGFDSAGGTYYEFTRPAGTGSTLTGWRQSAYEWNFDVNAYYVAIPFTAASTYTYYYGLVGAPVPYPLYSELQAVGAVTSPLGPLSPPTGTEFIIPNGPFTGANATFGPPAGYTETQSQYEQSIPVVNSLLLYAEPYPVNTVSTSFDAWNPFPYTPTDLVADCSGYILLRDSVFRVFSYPVNTSTQVFAEKYTFTMDEVFPPASNIDYLGSAANESNFAFFGLSNASPTPYLYIRTMDPATGAINATTAEPAPLGFQSSVQLFHARYNNFGGYVMSAQAYDSGSATTDISVVSKANASTTTFTSFTRQAGGGNIQEFLIGQSPKEEFGRFWVFPSRTGLAGPVPTGVQDFAYVNPNGAPQGSPPTGDYEAATGPLGGPASFYTEVQQYFLDQTAFSTYRSPIVTRDVAKDRVFFLSEAEPTAFFEAPISTSISTISIVSSVYTFPSTPTALYAGARGAKWAQIYDTMYGNRADGVDGPRHAEQAWQIFFPVQRIVFGEVSKQADSLFDLNGLQYPEYPHTALAVYDGSGNITADTSLKWGLESASNFITADFRFNGLYFNAYDYEVPVYDNRATGDYYYLSLRNYTPTEKSQVMLRVAAPNKYTFGYVTPLDLSGEISTAKYVSTTNDQFQTYYWDQTYTNAVLAYDREFIFSTLTFGANIIQGFAGSNVSSVTGWGDFYGRFLTTYQTYSTQVQLASTINTNTNIAVSNFIQTDLQYIIPTQALNRQRFTDPLRYSILWKTALTPAFNALDEEWGLGWNLGFKKQDTPYETVQRADSFFKILDDYIFLRLNPEFDMNRVDTTLKEKLSATQEPTGTTKSFYGKLLLANFGGYAQTMISNPLSFNPPFGRIDKLTFQWVNQVGAVLDNSDCEWNAVVQLVENLEIVPVPKAPLINPVPPTPSTLAVQAT